MCTALTYKTKDFYFGRTLDYEKSYKEQVVITPRNYKFLFRHVKNIAYHYAIIGIACVENNYPLYYDAVNEKGLCMAGLNFVGNAKYNNVIYIDSSNNNYCSKERGNNHNYNKDNSNKNVCYDRKDDIKIGNIDIDNIASFEFIPWILSRCTSVKEVRVLLEKINITNTAFNEELPPAQLHWIIADKEESIVIESEKDGLHIYNNPVGVLTNNPSFKEQIFNLNNYMTLSPKPPENHFSELLSFDEYSRGMGALGLPGDVSSQSRFVRVTFNRMNSKSGESEKESVAQFFHILGSVEQIRGCNEIVDGVYEITIYTCCCNADKGIYYYRTYNEWEIKAIDMHREELGGQDLICYYI